MVCIHTKQQQLDLPLHLPLVLPQLSLDLSVLLRIRVIFVSVSKAHDFCYGHSLAPHGNSTVLGESEVSGSEARNACRRVDLAAVRSLGDGGVCNGRTLLLCCLRQVTAEVMQCGECSATLWCLLFRGWPIAWYVVRWSHR